MAGAARDISLGPRRQGFRDRRGGRVPRLRPRGLHQRGHDRGRWRPFGPPRGRMRERESGMRTLAWLSLLIALAGTARADDFYAGKVISIYIGTGEGPGALS